MMKLNKIIKEFGFVILDGALATELESSGIKLHKTLWSAYSLIDNPQAIQSVHYNYFKAGADICTTASYQVSKEGFEKIGIDSKQTEKLLGYSVELAKKARDQFWNESSQQVKKKRPYPLIAASCGPYGAMLADGSEYTGNYANRVSLNQLIEFHRFRLKPLIENNPDLILFETIPTIKEGEAICSLLKEFKNVNAIISFCCRDGQLTSNNEKFEDCVKMVNQCDQIIAVGANCTHPKYIESLIKIAKANTNKYIIAYPNSGELWDEKNKKWIENTGETNFGKLAKVMYQSGAHIIGGCCRVGPEHISQIYRELKM